MIYNITYYTKGHSAKRLDQMPLKRFYEPAGRPFAPTRLVKVISIVQLAITCYVVYCYISMMFNYLCVYFCVFIVVISMRIIVIPITVIIITSIMIMIISSRTI